MDAQQVIRALAVPLAAAALLCAAAPVRAQAEKRIDLPAGRLSEQVPELARQAGVSISVTSEAIWRARGKAVRGNYAPGAALARMLEGTKGRAVQLSATSWRVEPRPRGVRPPPGQSGPVVATARDDAEEPIIITASKIDQSFENFAGSVHILQGGDLNFGGERGTEAILSQLASVASTHLGSGRNKLFIRGLADSSFTGPTQSTVGQYLADLRLAYNAPDPDLRLHDIARVEVLEGSQGTLYGAGSLGGIIRIVPNEADPTGFTLDGFAGASFIQHGSPGGDIGATVNLPIGESGHALRVTGYGISEGGYIDNPRRGEDDVNRTRIGGGRAALRLDLGDDWIVDLGGIYQATRMDDAQYAEKDGPPLTRSSLVVQNAGADYSMASIVVRKRWGDVLFQSSNAIVSHELTERFDANPKGTTPEIFDQHNETRMLVSETRFWRPVRDGWGWVVGVSAIDNRNEQRRKFTQRATRRPATGVSNDVTELTFYGKLSVEPVEGLALGAGGRFTESRLGGQGQDVQPQFTLAGAAIIASRHEREFLPSADALVHVLPGLALFARYEEGFRPGGLAIEGPFVRRYRNDHVASWEVGARWGRPFDVMSGSLSVSHAYWRDIQADFIDGNGLPSTANIGDGRITSIAATLALRPSPFFSMELGAVYNDGRVIALTPEVARLSAAMPSDLPVTGDRGGLVVSMPGEAGLGGLLGAFSPASDFGKVPNVAEYALQGRFDHVLPMGANDLQMGGWVKYIGPSRLGIGPVLGDEQGDYVDTGLAARFGNARRGVTLTLTNLFDARGNRFALGTPFDAAAGGFITPQRPRTIRIAFDYRL